MCFRQIDSRFRLAYEIGTTVAYHECDGKLDRIARRDILERTAPDEPRRAGRELGRLIGHHRSSGYPPVTFPFIFRELLGTPSAERPALLLILTEFRCF